MMADDKKTITPQEAIEAAILRYHRTQLGLNFPLAANAGLGDKAQRAAAEGLARTSAAAEQLQLKTQLEAHPNVSRFINELGDGNSSLNPKLAEALVTRWRASPDFLDKLEAELPGVGENDPKKTATAQLLKQTLTQPKNEAALIAALNDTTKPFDPAAVLVAANTPPAPAAGRTASSTAPAGGQQAPPPAARGHGAGGRAHAGGAVPNGHIIEYADELAKTAATYGIPADQIQHFQDAIKQRPELREKISAHLKKNPDLVVALNNFNQIDGRDVPPPYDQSVKAKIIEILENPDNLADPNFTSDFTGNVNLLSSAVPVKRGPGRKPAGPAAAGGGVGGAGSTPPPAGGGAGGTMAGVTGALGGIVDFLKSPAFAQGIQSIIAQLGPLMDQLKPLLAQLANSLGGLINGMGGSGTLRMAGGPDGGMSQRLGVHGGTKVDPNSGATTSSPAVARHDGPAGSGGHTSGQRVAAGHDSRHDHDHDRLRPGGPGTLIA